MAQVLLTNLKKSFGAVELFDSVDLRINHGEFVVFVGPSGSGKSTLLRMIAGLESATDGVIEIDGEDVTYEDPSDRGIAMVFQNYALYPHMDVFGNIAFNLRLSRLSKDEVQDRVMEAARILRIEDLLGRSPAQLSGGQRQRVAIGRAIVRKPKVFLFDEPLSNLDAALRTQMRLEIARLHREIGATMIYVTHDQTEAMTLADRIVALDYGEIQQVGTPDELYDAPANKFVGGFIGSPKMNFLEGTVAQANTDSTEIELDVLAGRRYRFSDISLDSGERVSIGIRPEEFLIDDDGQQGAMVLHGEIDNADRLGNITYAYVRVAENVTLTVQTFLKRKIPAGSQVTLSVAANKVCVFDSAGKNRIPNTY